MKKSMKLVLLVILVLSVGVFAFAGCSSTPYQKFLNTNWDKEKKEVATYDYTFEKGEEKIKGTLTTTIYQITEKNGNFTIGSKEYKDQKSGTYYKYELSVENGDYVKAEVFFKSETNRIYMPKASYMERKDGDKVQSVMLVYSGENCSVTVVNDGATTTQSEKVSKNGLVFDNAELHAVARTLNFSQNGTLSFQTPIYSNGEVFVKTVAMGATSTTKHNVKPKDENAEMDKTYAFINEGNEFSAVIVLLTINEKPSGLPQTVQVAKGTLKIGGESFTQPVIRIEEGNKEKGKSTYVLTNIVKEAI